MTAEGPGTALDNGAPRGLVRPYRSLAPWPLLLGAVFYLFSPPENFRPGPSCTQDGPRSSFRCSFLRHDGVLFRASLVLGVHIFNQASFLDFLNGSAWFTLVFWAMGLIFASILYWTAKYASFALQISPMHCS